MRWHSGRLKFSNGALQALRWANIDWRFLSRSPTVDYYFRSPLRDLITTMPWGSADRPIRQIGPHLFLTDRAAVLLRHATPSELDMLGDVGPGRKVFYLLDDDLGGNLDGDLPEDYRRRLVNFRTQVLGKILQVTDTLVVCSPKIADSLTARNIEVLLPATVADINGFRHFTKPVDVTDLLVSGTRSHLADIAMIAPALRRAVEANARLRITTYLGRHAPPALQRHPRILNRAPLPWPLFRQEYSGSAFHIAVSPHRQSAFNACRSTTKILEHASFGAAGLYSARAPYTAWIEHGRNGLLLNDNPSQWEQAIETLCRDSTTAEAIARRGAELATTIGEPLRVRDFWRERILA